MKLVKPIKLFCSWPPDESGLDQILASEAKPNIRTAATRVLRKTNATVGQELGRLDLQIAARLADAHAILLTEAVKQLNALLEHAVPSIAMRVLELLILTELPFLKQGSRGILAQEVGGQSAFKGPPEEHGGPSIFLLRAIQITMTIATRAGEVLADLGVAINHQATSDPGASSAAVGESSFQRLRGANPSRLRTEMPCTMVWLTFSTPCNPTSA